MEYVTLAFSIIAAVAAILALVFVLKNKKTGDITLGDDELKKIIDGK